MGKPAVLMSTFVFVLHLVLQEAASQVNLANKAANCKEVYLVTVENKSIGIKVSIISQNAISGGVTAQQPPQHQTIETKTINGHYLSPECGANYFRCIDLMVVSSTLNQTATQHIVFVPLANGLLLLDLNYNGSSLLFSNHQVIPMYTGCSPTAVVRILNGIYAVCMNSKAGHISAVQIYLNKTVLANTFISSALAQMDFSGHSPDLSTVTNFVHVNLDNEATSQFVYFSVAGSLYALVPPSYLSHDVGQLAHCTHADELVYAGGDTLIAYCQNSSVVNFDINFEDWINQTSYEEAGKPYPCPNQNVHLSVFSRASYIQYGLWSENTLENFNIPGLKFASGMCFGTQNKTFFAYYDREAGVYVLEPATSSLHRLSRSDSSVCEPVMVLENQYLIFQEKEFGDSTIIVVDSKNFSTLIEGQHTRADLVTLMRGIDLKCATERIPDIDIVVNDNQIPTEISSHTTLIILTTALSTAVVAVAVVGLLCTIVMVYYRRKRRSRERLKRPIRQATTSSKDDACYHLSSTNPAYPAMSRDTINSPVFAPVVQRQTHVYDEQQDKAVSQSATQVYAEKRTKPPTQQKTTVRNGLPASPSAAGLQTTATAGKRDCEISLTGAGELGSATNFADGAVESILVSKSKSNEKSAKEIEMKMVKMSSVETSSSVDSAIVMMDESFCSTLPIQEVTTRGSSSSAENLELGSDYNQDTDLLLPGED